MSVTDEHRIVSQIISLHSICYNYDKILNYHVHKGLYDGERQDWSVDLEDVFEFIDIWKAATSHGEISEKFPKEDNKQIKNYIKSKNKKYVKTAAPYFAKWTELYSKQFYEMIIMDLRKLKFELEIELRYLLVDNYQNMIVDY